MGWPPQVRVVALGLPLTEARQAQTMFRGAKQVGLREPSAVLRQHRPALIANVGSPQFSCTTFK